MDINQWLNVVDEAAQLGSGVLVVTVGSSLDECPEVWDLCRWAIDSHDMLVGIHLSHPQFSDDNVAKLREFDDTKLCIFATGKTAPAVREAIDGAVNVAVGECLNCAASDTDCELPKSMACVCDSGEMFTCGLVAQREGFYIGNVNDQRMDHLADDDSLPHSIPPGTDGGEHSCAGCPPMIEDNIRKALGV
jgi:hypothetical protein